MNADAPASTQAVPADRAFWAHPSAIVDEGAQIGASTRVWHFAHVCAGARIGEGCSLGQGVFVMTLDRGPDFERTQGITPIEGGAA